MLFWGEKHSLRRLVPLKKYHLDKSPLVPLGLS